MYTKLLRCNVVNFENACKMSCVKLNWVCEQNLALDKIKLIQTYESKRTKMFTNTDTVAHDAYTVETQMVHTIIK